MQLNFFKNAHKFYNNQESHYEIWKINHYYVNGLKWK